MSSSYLSVSAPQRAPQFPSQKFPFASRLPLRVIGGTHALPSPSCPPVVPLRAAASFRPRVKDWLLSIFGEWLLKKRISPYGHMTTFHIDTQNKKITLSAELRGETSPIDIAIDYARHDDATGAQEIEVKDVHISREWMNELAKSMLQQFPQRIPVPPGLVTTAVKVLNI